MMSLNRDLYRSSKLIATKICGLKVIRQNVSRNSLGYIVFSDFDSAIRNRRDSTPIGWATRYSMLRNHCCRIHHWEGQSPAIHACGPGELLPWKVRIG